MISFKISGRNLENYIPLRGIRIQDLILGHQIFTVIKSQRQQPQGFYFPFSSGKRKRIILKIL